MFITIHVAIHVADGFQNYTEVKEFETVEELFDFMNCERFSGRHIEFEDNFFDGATINIFDE